MRSTVKIGLLFVALVLSSSGIAQAVVIHNEAVDGDLGESTELGTFTNAASTIIGSLDGGVSGSSSDGPDESDEIRFTTLAPWTLYIDSLASNGMVVLWENSLGQGITSIFVSGPKAVLFFGNSSQNAGTWGLEFVPFGNRGQLDYQATIRQDVPDVPEPASLAMGLLGTALIAVRRRR